MGDELQRSARHAVLHGLLVKLIRRILVQTVVTILDGLIGQFPALVRQVDKPRLVERNHTGSLRVRQQAVIGRADQEVVKSLAGHQAPDRLAQGGLVAVGHRVQLGLGGKPPGKQQRGATHRLSRRGKGDAVEQRVRGKRPGRGLAPQRAQELLHVGEVGRSGHHLDAPAVRLGSLDFVEDQVRPALDRIQEVLEHRQVRSLVALHVLRRQHQPRMAGRPALDVAVDALRLHDGRRDVVAEQSAGGLRRRRDASPRLACRREPRLQRARNALLEPARLGTLGTEGRTDGLRLDRVADLLQAFMSRLAPRL